MKEIVVISGKGGTGKTSIVAAFAALAKKAVLADCDVDAADLHLVLEPKVKHESDFSGGKRASIVSAAADARNFVDSMPYTSMERITTWLTRRLPLIRFRAKAARYVWSSARWMRLNLMIA